MGILYTARTRLLAGALVVLATSSAAVNATQQASAQGNRETVSCGNEQAITRVRNASASRIDWAPSASPGVELASGILDSPTSTDAQRSQAAAACEAGRFNGTRFNVPAYFCVANARARSAETDQAAATTAYCNYQAAATLAQRARHHGEEEGRAHIGRGRMLAALGHSTTEVADAYDAAIRADPEHATTAHVAIARNYIRLNDFPGARANLVTPDNHPIAREDQVGLAIVELVQAMPASSTERLPLLRIAREAGGSSVVVMSTVGGALLNAGYDDEARQALDQALGLSAQGDQAIRAKAQAYYYLAVLHARADDWQYVVANETNMAAAGMADQPRLACLAALQLGGRNVYQRGTSDHGPPPAEEMLGYRQCNLVGAAQQNLLMGMFYLRRSQYMPASSSGQRDAWRRTVANAVDRFRQARTALGSDYTTKVEWPMPVSARSTSTIFEVLDYAREFARYAESGCQGTQPDDPSGGRAREAFNYYHLNTCGPLRAED
jgi:hypothetical protein